MFTGRGAVAVLSTPQTIAPAKIIVSARNVHVRFPVVGGHSVKAVTNVSLDIRRGEVFGLVGESGSGKTTLGRALLRLVDLSEGSVLFDGKDISEMDAHQIRTMRKRMQVIFQDPFGSLNPRMSVESILQEAVQLVDGRSKTAFRISELLNLVGLSDSARGRHPHEFSGGQRQRICIARALALRPEFIVADEPVAALDVSIQAQIINLLHDLKQELNLTMLFIAHDLAVVRHISDRIGVMYLGSMQEIGPASEVVANPLHPYSSALLSAVPVPDPTKQTKRQVLDGDLPSPIHPPSGCVFRTRCPVADAACADTVPQLSSVAPDRSVACLKVGQ
ncbi:MAG: ATP-binding cassette domain-containing protein [Bacteroidetes Order II. Incertae sedis bacterium]|nr:ATP-binding cassette domain-containing protein [Bacteroidetes Order II. bacterium]MBT4601565.1 ATP-binding cassette domain-containing protein [Bacteroidetes Order II. bacterium]MBT5249059.1 ATP-binding cassette domain-containing protein [Bacteroidetes Order II. bacterium]MBT6199405.1 ATP-binding cassette domain-containing protein [Bacteroidetes Order II. bacterium]MBT6425941.1 ATP-binding cassette domain-containing protein [Bacteroidetes Order II. bacterium]